MNPRALIALVLVAAFVLGAVVLVAASRDPEPSASQKRFEGATAPPGLRAPELSGLKDQDGEPLSMRALRGRPVIVTFLYTTCEETCPTQAQQVKAALDELGADVPAVAIAVDPPRDTAERARGFLSKQRMTGRMDFAVGSRSRLAAVWKGYAIEPQRDDLEHTGRFVLVDPKGLQRIGFPIDQATPERLAHDLRLLAAGA